MNRYSKGKLNVNMSDWTWSEKQESIQMFMPREWEFCFRLYLQRRESHTVRKINTPFGCVIFYFVKSVKVLLEQKSTNYK